MVFTAIMPPDQKYTPQWNKIFQLPRFDFFMWRAAVILYTCGWHFLFF